MARAEFSCSVKVQPLPEQSDVEAGRHAYAYTVTIVNRGDVTAQLIARHWIITDQQGRTQEVRGLAVVGHQPLLEPGKSFEYTSWTLLDTPQGTMRGTFFCITEDARWFEAPVPEFMLADTATLH